MCSRHSVTPPFVQRTSAQRGFSRRRGLSGSGKRLWIEGSDPSRNQRIKIILENKGSENRKFNLANRKFMPEISRHLPVIQGTGNSGNSCRKYKVISREIPDIESYFRRNMGEIRREKRPTAGNTLPGTQGYFRYKVISGEIPAGV